MFAHLSKTQKGMALAFLGYTTFAFSDTCVKLLAERGYSIFQIVTVDTFIGATLMLAFSAKLGGIRSLKDKANAKIHALRIGLNTAVNILIVYCFTIMPLATVYTAVFTKPFIAALIAMPLYGEKIGIHRWACIAAGFTGILVAFQPWRADTDLMMMVLPMLTTIVIAAMFVVARSLQGSSLLAIGFYPVLGSCILISPLAFMNFTPMEMADFPYFVLSGIFMSTGIICVSLAFRMADSAAVSPIMYSELIWAILFGALLFGDFPDTWMMAGAAIIITSGIYLVRREQLAAQK